MLLEREKQEEFKTSNHSTRNQAIAFALMVAVTDVLMVLRQARDGRMARSKLIEVIVAREGLAQREATTAAVEKVIAFQIEKGRIASETKNGIGFLKMLK